MNATDQVLGGRYRLTERIAGGGMGEVWRGVDEVLGRDVAVKILRKEYADDPTFLARFRAEARHTANLSHPGIAAVYDFGEGTGTGSDDESPFLVMEHVPGEPLSALVAREGALGAERTLRIIGQTALALQAAHDAGVIHRDVKPGNILVTSSGEVKITDFGIARATNSVPLTQTGAIMGTAYYISPEQASGGSVTPASDLYSLGIVAYECLSGTRPFSGNTPVSVALAQVREEPPQLPAEIPAPARDLVMRLLAKDPADRPGSAGELGAAALALAPTVAAVGPTAGAAPPDATRVLTVPTPAADTDLRDDKDGGPSYAEPTATVRRDPADTDPGFHLPPPARRPAWLPAALAAGVGVLLLLLLVRACGAEDTGPVTTTGPGSPSATAPTTLEVVAADFVGRPVAEASAELEGLGLRVEVVESAGGGTVGTVKDVAPTGTVVEGSLVTLTAVAAAPDAGGGQGTDSGPADSDPGKSKGKGKGKR